MAIDRRPSGSWRVRYRDPAVLNEHGKPRVVNRHFDDENDAILFDAEVKRAKQRREPLPTTGVGSGATFSEVGKLWRDAQNWTSTATYGEHEITQRLHLDPYIGSHVVRLMTPTDVLTLPAKLRAAGDSPRTIRRALQDARSILSHAVILGIRTDNPAAEVNSVMPPADPTPPVQPLTPERIERIRDAIMARRAPNRLRDATIVSVLAYAGVRPGEMRGLRWSDWEDGRLAVVRQITTEEKVGRTKRRGNADRRIIPWAPLVDDLTAWRNASGGEGDAYVFPGAAGDFMSKSEYANWRGRVWADISGFPKPYVLRHSHASLRVRSGEDRTTVAHNLGHTVSMLELRYSHHFAEYDDHPVTIDPQALIYKARGQEPPQAQRGDLSDLTGEERELILARRAEIARKTAEAADHDAEDEAAWDSVA